MLWNEIRLTTCSTFISLILTIVPFGYHVGSNASPGVFTCKASRSLANLLRSEDRQTVSNVQRCKSPAQGQANCSLRKARCVVKQRKATKPMKSAHSDLQSESKCKPCRSLSQRFQHLSPICAMCSKDPAITLEMWPDTCVAETNICCSKLTKSCQID